MSVSVFVCPRIRYSSSNEQRAGISFSSCDRAKNWIPQPVGMSDPALIGLKRLNRRINPQVAIGLILILPAFVPINGSLDARIAGPEKVETFLNPRSLVA